ncbi:ryanodine receptor-like [Centruroides sculpturatus]|uniref:ryanodine receptor-like n=1 Tax=Centruroides sculpturatus TaxID=218467 RepID=UPI000C6E7B04|nr:ryanodine receptor-like [Centruroides sculpturatus]
MHIGLLMYSDKALVIATEEDHKLKMLTRFLETASSVLNYFEPFLGRIEILGGQNRIERVYFEIKESTINQWEKPQIKVTMFKFFRSAFEPVKRGLRYVFNLIVSFLCLFTPSNLKKQYAIMCQKTYLELIKGFFLIIFNTFFYTGWYIYFSVRAVTKFIMLLMGGQPLYPVPEEEETMKVDLFFKPGVMVPMGTPLAIETMPMGELALLGEPSETVAPMQAFGVDITKEEEDGEIRYHMAPTQTQPEITPQSSLELSEQEQTSEEESKASPTSEASPDKAITDGATPETMFKFFRSAFEPVKRGLRYVFNLIVSFLCLFTPSNLKKQYAIMCQKTYLELIKGFFLIIFNTFFYTGWYIYFSVRAVTKFIMLLMGGQPLYPVPEEEETMKVDLFFKPGVMVPMGTPLAIETMPMGELALLGEPSETVAPMQAFGVDITKEEEDGEIRYHMAPTQTQPEITPQSSLELSEQEQTSEEESKASPTSEASPDKAITDGATPEVNHIGKEIVPVSDVPQPPEAPQKVPVMMPMAAEPQASAEPPPPVAAIDLSEYTQKFVSFLARNFYTMKYMALVMAFCINFILLFYKVTSPEVDDDDEENGEEEENGDIMGNFTEEIDDGGILGDDDDEDIEEWVVIEEKVFYLEPVIRMLALLHSLVSFCMLIAYYNLKVPLAIFKREKEIARAVEFDGLYISEQPSEDDIHGHWDKLVISTRSFPVNYWDKFVKKRVREKYSETYDYEAISNLLGMDKSGSFRQEEEITGFWSLITSMDWKYQIWKAGVTFTDNSFLYNLWYFTFSVMGNFNHFFFAAHLLDVAVGFKTLRTILQSVTHNGKQLVLTVMLLTIIVYIYTVIAFNFFRKFYVQEEEEQVDQKCHNMLTCFVFHLYKGVRAGGGIGDEIEPPDGDDYELYRIIFDITFFFFIIVILLAIIQGLIIDAFGELRDQLQSVVEDMESNCFICGIGKDYFDKVPHGFDTHVQKEHNLANYMFFLMHLINKPDTEYTGQETYVWEYYQKRCWDFFPVGDCFRKQYEGELEGTG